MLKYLKCMCNGEFMKEKKINELGEIENETSLVQVRMSPNFVARLDAEAALQMRGRANLIRLVLAEYLEDKESERGVKK